MEHLKSQLGSKSPKTYAGLAAAGGKLAGAPRAARDGSQRTAAAAVPTSAFFDRQTPSPDLLAKVVRAEGLYVHLFSHTRACACSPNKG